MKNKQKVVLKLSLNAAKSMLAVFSLFLLSGCATPQENTTPIKPTTIQAASPTEAAEPLAIDIAGQGNEVEPTKGAVPTFSPTLTVSPAPTVSPTPTASPTPTVSPTPTASPTPMATPAPTPSPTPIWHGTDGEVAFSEAGYFFKDTLQLELVLQENKDGYITYTMDGREPQEDGRRYEEPLVLEGTEEVSPKVYTIRAKAWYGDGTSSDTYVHTYFVGATVEERYSTVIFSINGNPAELTEGPDGILYGTNYEEMGRESERKVSIEAVSPEGELLFAQYAGVRVFGGSSRKHPVKSLKLYARKEYQEGMGTFETTIFGSRTLDGEKKIKKYDRLVLRNYGSDFQRGFIRDELAQRLAAQAGFQAYEAVVPALAYLNGEYYCFYWLHESYCDKYFQYRNGKSAGEYVVLEGSETKKHSGDEKIEKAARKEYEALYKKYSTANLTDEAIYAELCDLVDVENYLEYMAFNMYIVNYDWPNGNYRCFRYYAAEDEDYGTGEMDGRWRYLLHDMDVGFAIYSTASKGASRNDIVELTNESNARYAPLFAALMKREDCQQYFIRKMLEFRDGALSYENVCATLSDMLKERDGELSYYLEHLQELKKQGAEIDSSSKETERHIKRIMDFAELRGENVTKYLEEYFDVELE